MQFAAGLVSLRRPRQTCRTDVNARSSVKSSGVSRAIFARTNRLALNRSIKRERKRVKRTVCLTGTHRGHNRDTTFACNFSFTDRFRRQEESDEREKEGSRGNSRRGKTASELIRNREASNRTLSEIKERQGGDGLLQLRMQLEHPTN